MTTATTTAHPAPRRSRGAVRLALALLVVMLGALVFSVATASATGSFGPNVARYDVTLDRRVVIDLGPLGTVQIPSPAPRPLGVRVVVGEIPDDLPSVRSADSISALATDASEYLQFFSDTDAVVSQAVTSLAQDAARRFAWCLLGLAALVGAGVVLLGRERRHAVGQRTAAWIAPVAFVALVGMVAGGAAISLRPMPLQGRTSIALAGTSLADTHITGRLAGAIDSFGATVVEAYRKNEAFYADANTNLQAAWDAREASDALAILQTPSLPPVLAPDGTGTSTSTSPDGTGTTSPLGVPELSPITSVDDDVVTLLVVADIHCNTGMSPLVATAVQRSGASVLLHAGDATIDGSSVEKVCVTSVTRAAGKATVVFVGGNHDSAQTADQFAAAGAVVLRGKTQTVDGITILGNLDPYVSRTGQPTRLAGETTEAEASQALATTACEDHPDLLLIHNPRIGAQALATGCVPDQISGHLHRRVGPEVSGAGVLYVNSSTAGALEGQLTVGPLHGTAEMTVMRYDVTTHQMVSYRVVQVMTDGSATVGPWLPYPQPPTAMPDGATTEGAVPDSATTQGATTGS